MNYRFFRDTVSEQFITDFTQVPELRPKVNDIVTFRHDRTKWVITRENPISTSILRITSQSGKNIVTQAGLIIIAQASADRDVSFDYFVREQDTSYDTVSLRGSNDNVLRQLFR